VLAAAAVLASGYLADQPGDARLVANRSPAPVAPSPVVPSPGGGPASVSGAEPAAFALPCAASWGQAGVLAAVFSTPAAPAGVNVCGAGSLRPAPAPASCTKVVAANALQPALDAANPGDRICAQGVSQQRLTISRSGTPAAPVQVIGVGQTAVKGITIKANDVVVAGFNSAFAVAPGIELSGNDITLLNNTVSSPRGGDGDGIRFFGNNINILHNTVRDIRNLGGAHADCMQTFATNTPTSQRVLIAANRCEQIDNQCLIAEGPHSSAGDGSGQGQSSDITFTNNYCDTNASQALMIDDVQNVVVTFNSVTGGNEKAFAFANKSTGAKVSSNVVARGIGYAVGMDSSSQQGYQGPPVGGKP
jgi:parallel beta helix pectate lyase-like protein